MICSSGDASIRRLVHNVQLVDLVLFILKVNILC